MQHPPEPQTDNPKAYRGRFAPSPTGDLHFGSLIAAVGSYLQAKSNRGQWLVRIEDLDPPREVAGSAASILADLRRLGLNWDGTISYQSQRNEAYRQALDRLLDRKQAYWCGCSRKQLPATGIYPGTCRAGLAPGRPPRTVRLRTTADTVTCRDRLQGRFSQQLERDVGDFVLRRADGLFAYQLAVVIDDADQEITEVVRGADLLDSTPRQIFLQRQLGLPTPGYVHLPVATDRNGKKLSKRHASDPVKRLPPVAVLRTSLGFLGHPPPEEIHDLDQLRRWAIENWCLQRVPARAEWPLSSHSEPA